MTNDSVPLSEAKNQFTKSFETLNEAERSKFLEFVLNQWTNKMYELNLNDNDADDNDDKDILDDPIFILNSIADDLKKKVSVDAILPSENIIPPIKGENADCSSSMTAHVDTFLYTEADVENLVEEGKIKRDYCEDCGSKNIKPLIFISHSTSRDELYWIFNNNLPTLDNKVVLDIGSRFGAILYGAYVFSDAPKIIGVEMNGDFCKMQDEIIRKYKMQDRIEVIHKKIEEVPEIVKTADVIIMNNPFEFYLPEEQQVKNWQFLKQHIKKGAILVISPQLEKVFSTLKIEINLDKWVKPYKLDDSNVNDIEVEDFGTAFYEVL